MKKFIIEREIPGAGNLSTEELKKITQSSCEVVNKLEKPYHWIQSFVAGDKIYCIHVAQDEETIREHAKLGGFPANKITEVSAVIDPSFGSN